MIMTHLKFFLVCSLHLLHKEEAYVWMIYIFQMELGF